MQLSAVIITHNEERNIARCIESVSQVCDDIVVLDSFSTDATKAICNKYSKVNFVQRDWEGYSAAKNYANSLARYPFILSLDADEYLSDTLIQSIKSAELSQQIVYSMNRLNNYCGTWVKHGGWYPDKKIRIFHKDSAHWQGEFVHETLALKSGVITKHLQGDLMHMAFLSINDHISKIEKYAILQAAQLKAHGKKTGGHKLILAPLAKFIRCYVLQLGFLDGKAGFNIARFSAYGVYKKYKLLNQ